MLGKLIKFAALGYIGVKALKALRSGDTAAGERWQDIRLAGGQLSPNATLQHSPDLPSER